MLNGSPRGTGSNTRILFEQLLAGMRSVDADLEAEVMYLRNIRDTGNHVQSVVDADMVLLGFPLYTDGMPGIVKHFIDALHPNDLGGKPLGFLVQSGFPEARHSRPVARYLARLSMRLNARHVGTLIRGGVEGIQLQPAGMTKRLFQRFFALGASLARDGQFDEKLVRKLAKPETLNPAARLFLQTDASHFYWDMKLKENNAFDQRFDQPYAPGTGERKEEI
jgi:NAD(P)H-dependent FMN reductase